ncbi:hypothetical protein DOT_4772 [Desulfosporosinus sp. OT]|nr:hypothetical protein DOT_4772 [Desulfosporosinus sp. OT]
MSNMLTPGLEDYLEEIYRFSLSLNTVRVTDISKGLKLLCHQYLKLSIN